MPAPGARHPAAGRNRRADHRAEAASSVTVGAGQRPPSHGEPAEIKASGAESRPELPTADTR